MKIMFMGSAAFATPSLRALAESGREIVEVVTQPDKPAGRGMKVTACPVAIVARELGLGLYQPPSVKKPEVIEHFKKIKPDLIVVVAYGKILPNALLEIPKLGSVNVHSSLLPKYRGAAPINWAIVNGETKTGVTTQMISEELDAGDILMSVSTEIDEVENAQMLHDRLAEMGAELLIKTLDGIEKGTLKRIVQNHADATHAPIIKKEDGHIVWSKTANEVYNLIRGMTPWPGTFSMLDGKILRIHDAAPLDIDHDKKPGTVIEADRHLAVACGKGMVYLVEVQLEGKKRMSAMDFLRGHKVPVGTVLE